MLRHLFLIPFYLLACALPLLSPVGANLEYEYALLASYAMLLLVPFAGVLLPAAWLPRTTAGTFKPAAALDVLWALLAAPLAGLAPGAVMFLFGACPCSRMGYLFWMGTLWLPATVLAHALLAAVLRARVRSMPRAWAAGILLVFYAAAAVSIVVRLWVNPQKRLVDPIAGFLHGPIYDSWIAFDLGLMLARGSHLALALGLLLGAQLARRTYVTAVAATLILAGAVGLQVGAQRFYSVRDQKQDLDELLYGTLPGDGFTLHYRPSTASDDKRPEAQAIEPRPTPDIPLPIQRLHRDAQFHVAELTTILAEGGRQLPHVDIYVYPSEEKKKLWFGGGSTDVTDVYTPSIHITDDAWPHPTLRHELVHALASGMAYHGLGFHPNLAFTEGLAVALAPTSATLSLDDGAASVLASKRIPNVGALFSPMFWRESGGRAYTVAGSFIKFLIASKGIHGVLALYAGADWHAAFAEERDSLVAQWQTRILASYDRDRNSLYAEALFRYPGLFADDCPHSKADLSHSRSEGAFARMRQPIGWDPSEDYLPWLLQLDPGDKGTRTRQWKREIRKVAADRWLAEGRLATWREAVAAAHATPAATLEDIELALLDSDLARMLGDVQSSLSILRDLKQAGQARYFGESLTREIEARLVIEESLDATPAVEWRKLLAGWRQGLPDAAANEPWLISYLRLRNEKPGSRTPDQLSQLLATPPDASVAAGFHFEWYRILADRLMRGGAFAAAATAFEQAAAVGTSGNRELFAEHARRARYYHQSGPLAAVAPAAAAAASSRR